MKTTTEGPEKGDDMVATQTTNKRTTVVKRMTVKMVTRGKGLILIEGHMVTDSQMVTGGHMVTENQMVTAGHMVTANQMVTAGHMVTDVHTIAVWHTVTDVHTIAV